MLAKDGARVKASLTNYENGNTKYFMFNPSGFGDSKGANYGTIDAPMQASPRYVFQGGKESSVTGLDLYYKGTPQEVRSMVIWLQDFLPYAQDGVTVRVPPTLIFTWGGWYVKRLILDDLNTDYTDFDAVLDPIECIMSLSVRIVPMGMPIWNSTGGI